MGFKIIFDTETTGLPADYKASSKDFDKWPSPIEIAWVIIDEEFGVVSEHNHIIAQPEGFVLDPKITEITGITLEKLQEEGEDIETILNAFAVDAAECESMIAHNISFDRKILKAAWYRAFGIEEECPIFPMDKNQVCTMQSSTKRCAVPAAGRAGYKWPKLSEAYEILVGMPMKTAHRALVDVQATIEVLQKLHEENLVKI